jgi:hypothetical protein
MSLTMEVRAYREKPGARHATKRSALDLWAYLSATTPLAEDGAGHS